MERVVAQVDQPRPPGVGQIQPPLVAGDDQFLGRGRVAVARRKTVSFRDRGGRFVELRQAEEIGDPAAVQALMDALKSTDPQVRKSAAEALGNKD